MLGLIVRLIVSAIVLMLVSFLLPGFASMGFTVSLVAAIVIALLGFIIESVLGKSISPQNRGIVGFLTSAVVIYLTQFLVTGMEVTILGSALAAFVIGVIDASVPTELR